MTCFLEQILNSRVTYFSDGGSKSFDIRESDGESAEDARDPAAGSFFMYDVRLSANVPGRKLTQPCRRFVPSLVNN